MISQHRYSVREILAHFLLPVACCLLSLLSSCAFQNETCELIVHNATIYTVDEKFSVYEAMAIRDGKIIDIGAEQSILNNYTAEVVIDAMKKPVYPGFIDAHCHFFAYGKTLQEANLVGTKSFDEVIERVKKHSEKTDHPWIIESDLR